MSGHTYELMDCIGRTGQVLDITYLYNLAKVGDMNGHTDQLMG